MKRVLPVVMLILAVGCGGDDAPTAPTGPSELVIEDLTVGTGATVASGDTITVHYVGMFLDGRVFDSSVSRGTPITFQAGGRGVIEGFSQGVIGMKIGGHRRLTVPPGLAYGSSGNGPIPPNTTIRFDVELLSIAGK